MERLTKMQIAEVCRRYQAGESSPALAKEFGISVPAICGLLDRRGIERREQSFAQRRYVCDHTFFSSIDTEAQAYWLGFVAADGYVSGSNKDSKDALVVHLQWQDRDHLYRLRDALQSTHPVKEYHYSYGDIAKLFIRSEQLTQDLAQYGIVPAKTFTVPWPDFSDALLIHFLRGYVDGDGGFHIHELKNHYTFELTSNRGFVEPCQQFLMRMCHVSQTKLFQRHSSPIFTLRYNGRLGIARIAELLYTNATIFMPRKRDAAMLISKNR